MNPKKSSVPLPKIGTYWYGPTLSAIERACLCSMLEHGHAVTLFSHDAVDGVPQEVEMCDAREVIGDRPVVMNEALNSPALFADQFRYHMIDQFGYLWLDLDVFVLKPLVPRDGYLFGYEPQKRRRYIYGGVLGLPQSSPTLRDLIHFCEDEFPIPPYATLRTKILLNLKMRLGRPVHVSRQQWGVWGPRALTWFLRRNGEDSHAFDTGLYPIDWDQLDVLFSPYESVWEIHLKEALTVHLYGTPLRRKIEKIGWNAIPQDSFLKKILRHGT